MTLNGYQTAARQTALYPDMGRNLTYPVLGLVGEAGELANVVKKILRDDSGVLTEQRREQLAAEVADCLWYCAAVAWELGMDLEEIAKNGLAKLADRASRGTIHGDGDKR